ncbi:MAG TPA: acyl-CoA dehydrogenase family protein [Acidimicrobiales bacterium]|jgi:alkylation response protein AidB-like acyl-CoA dehydrogenase
MDVRFSPEQDALRDAARHVAEQLGPHRVADLDDAERAAKLDAAVASSGWRELRTPVDSAATPLASAVEVAVVAEQLGRVVADTAFLGPTLAADLRRLGGADVAQRPETVALTPDLAGPALASGGVAPGDVRALDAHGAVDALVLVPGDNGHRLATVGLGAHVPGVDLTRTAHALEAGSVTVIDSQPLGADELARWQTLGLAASCADLVGVMSGALDLATEYARQRRQYGAPIGSFQAVAHLLADAHTAMEGSRSIALHAAWAVDALEPSDALGAVAAAKAYCARAARSVCETAIQVHGGIGNTWECSAHLYLRRALFSGELLGGVGACLDRVLSARGIGGAGGLR